jgi:Tol biopolymer transport system component
MTWVVLAAVWAMWPHGPETRCADVEHHLARQRLSGSTGVATVDVSADGRVVAFVSLARLAAGDDNTAEDVYVLERATGTISLESARGNGRASDGSSQHPRLSGDGRFLVFSTVATNLVGSRGQGIDTQVLRRDRTTGVTTLVSRTPAGAPGNGWSGVPDISDDGRFVVFESHATDLVAGPDRNHGGSDIYLFDAADGVIRRVSVTTAGEQLATGQSGTPAISGAGRVVAFSSTAPLDAPPGQPARQTSRRGVFVRDIADGVTRRISTSGDRDGANGDSYFPAISGDGRRVAFVSTATNLDDDARARRQENVYLHDDGMPRLRLLSRSASGGAADGASRHPAVSGDGRYVLFSSDASNLHCTDRCGPSEDLNLVMDVYRLDTVTGVADRVSGGPFAREPWWNASSGVASDGSGRVVAFSSREPIDHADLAHDDDLFVEVLPACNPARSAFVYRLERSASGGPGLEGRSTLWPRSSATSATRFGSSGPPASSPSRRC